MAPSSTYRLRPAVVATPWTLDEVAGRFVEISGAAASAALTLTFTLIREAQQLGEPVGWITLAEHSFYPPDAAQGGIDLDALVVVRLARAESIARAGKLLRPAFGVVVLDLGAADIDAAADALSAWRIANTRR
jgi:recombination protein RecA